MSLRGRSDDVINYGGLKLQPEDIEAVLTEHPDIEDAAVVEMSYGGDVAARLCDPVLRNSAGRMAIHRRA